MSWNLAKPYGRRDRVAVGIANFVLRFTSERYRQMLEGLVVEGMMAAAQEAGLGASRVCAHEWVDARNVAVESGEVCKRCGATRPGNES